MSNNLKKIIQFIFNVLINGLVYRSQHLDDHSAFVLEPQYY